MSLIYPPLADSMMEAGMEEVEAYVPSARTLLHSISEPT